MGIEGLYKELSKHHLNPQAIDVKELAQRPNTTIEIDLFGAFYTTVIDTITKEYFQEGARSTRPGYQLPPRGREARRTGYALAGIIQQTFGRVDNIIIHIDGDPCQEKTKAYGSRQTAKQERIRNLEVLQARMDARSAQGRFTSRSCVRDIKKHLWQIFRLTADDKNFMTEAMREKGCTVCQCTTESDFCIGRRAGIQGQERYVVSGDSDLLIYRNVQQVIRPLPKTRGVFSQYTKQAVLEALGFPTPEHLTLYGIVSKNDYTSNIPNISLAGNRKIIQGLRPNTIDMMLNDYTREVNKATGRQHDTRALFRQSLRCFMDHQQTPLVLMPWSDLNLSFIAHHANFRLSIRIRFNNRTQATAQP